MIDKKRFRKWMKLYALGIIISISSILIIIFTILYADKIKNLQETILILALLSPYVILYIQQIKKRKESSERLKVISLKLKALINYLHKFSYRNALVDIDIFSMNDISKISGNSFELRTHFNNVQGLINDIIKNDINDLTKLELYTIGSEGLYIHFKDKYLIGIRGIFEGSSKNDMSSEESKIKEIKKEIDDLV